MFEPNSFFEKRISLIESTMLGFLEAAGGGEFAQQYFARLDALKLHRANEVLGPLPEIAEDQIASGVFFVEALRPLFAAKGLNTMTENQEEYAFAMNNAEELTNIDTAFAEHGRAPDGVYKMQTHSGNFAPALAFIVNEVQYFAVLDGGLSMGCVALQHLPTTMDLRKHSGSWRLEVFPYRGDLTKAEVEAVLLNTIAMLPNKEFVPAPVETIDAPVVSEAANDAAVAAEAGVDDPLLGLFGSSTLPSTVQITEGLEVSLGDIVRGAFETSGLSTSEWNALSEADRDGRLNAHIELMRL